MGNMTVLGTHDGGRNDCSGKTHDGGQNPYGQYDCSGNIHDDTQYGQYDCSGNIHDGGQTMSNMTVLGTQTVDKIWEI